ncbi:hypothetical protein ACFW6R_29420 [Streptomyces albidoflavus]
MRYTHTIEATDNGEDPIWYTLIHADAPEDHDGTAADYGRTVLDNWIDDNSGSDITDEYGNPLLRVRVTFAEDTLGFVAAALVDCTQLDAPSPKMAALEAARERKLYVQLLDALADAQLEEALTAARASGDRSANALAAFVYPAVSRPVALRMMQS